MGFIDNSVPFVFTGCLSFHCVNCVFLVWFMDTGVEYTFELVAIVRGVMTAWCVWHGLSELPAANWCTPEPCYPIPPPWIELPIKETTGLLAVFWVVLLSVTAILPLRRLISLLRPWLKLADRQNSTMSTHAILQVSKRESAIVISTLCVLPLGARLRLLLIVFLSLCDSGHREPEGMAERWALLQMSWWADTKHI